jgi:hypothetical protein
MAAMARCPEPGCVFLAGRCPEHRDPDPQPPRSDRWARIAELDAHARREHQRTVAAGDAGRGFAKYRGLTKASREESIAARRQLSVSMSARGMNTAEIARRLGVTTRTVQADLAITKAAAAELNAAAGLEAAASPRDLAVVTALASCSSAVTAAGRAMAAVS